MDKFDGFTEEEIRNLTSSRSVNSDGKHIAATAVYKNQQIKTRYQNRLSRKNVARERLLKGSYNVASNIIANTLPQEARLYIPQIPEEEEYEIEEIKDKQKNNLDIKASIIQNEKIQKKEENKNIASTTTPKAVLDQNVKNISESKETKEKIKKAEKFPILNSEDADVDALEQFESRQKLMEEQNRQRKEILKKALADRAKKTHEEVKKLNEIEGELKKLDLLLSNDVAIIRNQIESASIDYMEAQKRYDKAEKEFLDAKLDLFNKKERKELLTSHLCTIIEQNEMRKAKKLSDLMMQLEIAPKSSLIKVEYKEEQEDKEKNQSIHHLNNNNNNNNVIKQTEVKEETMNADDA
ncbi:uncharacterized protein LOC142329603 [Lycorma delicatula]|uniref:uncharacterized protein LOC142329603 n=1 Tax=Lycorma delicatula TaxID=130591 RepID=UPI003F51A022